MKRVYFTLALMSLFGGLNAFADVEQNGVVYDKMPDGKCLVVGYDEAKMPEGGIVTIAATVNINGTDCPVTGILGSENYNTTDNKYDNGKTGDKRAAFFNCKKITGLKFADGSGVTWIGDHAFKDCLNLKTIENIPSELNDIQAWCFEGTALESVNLSNTKLQWLRSGCFYNSKHLKVVKFPSTLTSPNDGLWKNEDDDKYGKQAFQGTAIESIDLSNTNLISLGDYMFDGCILQTVKLPKTLKYIWQYAFSNSKLSSITLPNFLQSIDNNAFQNTQLANVVIPTSCNTIKYAAFAHNDNLKTVVINGTQCYLDFEAFAYCNNLKDVYITSNIQPTAELYNFPFRDDPKVHVMKDYVDAFNKLQKQTNDGLLNPCNTTHFDYIFSHTLSKEWTTFTSAYNLDFSSAEGLTAYTAKYNKDNDAVALTPVKKVAAHTGLILKGEAGKTYTLSILASNEAELDAVPDNSQLVDCVDAVWSSSSDKDYFLSGDKFVNSTNAGWALPGKSYLYISSGRVNQSDSHSPLRVYVDNTATSIDGITNNPVVKDEAYYNLQGVKVQHPQHGVFIHNGKKVVLK